MNQVLKFSAVFRCQLKHKEYIIGPRSPNQLVVEPGLKSVDLTQEAMLFTFRMIIAAWEGKHNAVWVDFANAR